MRVKKITNGMWGAEYGLLGRSGVGQGGGEEWMGYKVWWTGQGCRVMGYAEGERAGKCCEDKCCRTGYSVEEQGAAGESIIPEFQSPAAPGANQRQLEADSTSYSYL